MSGVTGAVVAGVASAAVGAGVSAVEANKSAGAVSRAANASNDLIKNQYDQTRADQAPFRTTGVSALDQIAKLYGLDTMDAEGNVVKGTGKADFSSFTQSPDYQFALDQGQQAIDRSAAARGGLLSGAAVKAGEGYASGLASQNFQSYYGNLAGLAGAAQASTNATSAAGSTAVGQISANNNNAGNARASAYGSIGTTVGNTVNGLASNYLLSKYAPPASEPFTIGPLGARA